VKEATERMNLLFPKMEGHEKRTADYNAKKCNPMKKKTHGGKRKGSGRPKGEPTKTMRVPVSKVEEVKFILSRRSPRQERRGGLEKP
jgi:hypothetical protein